MSINSKEQENNVPLITKIRNLIENLDLERAKGKTLHDNYTKAKRASSQNYSDLKRRLEKLVIIRDPKGFFYCPAHPQTLASVISCPCRHAHCEQCEAEARATPGLPIKLGTTIFESKGCCLFCGKSVPGWYENQMRIGDECTKCEDCLYDTLSYKVAPSKHTANE